MNKKLQSLLLFLSIATFAFARQANVSGTVTDSEGEPMPGVNVVQKGTSSGTVTGINGEYTISVPSDAVLIFSFVGFATQDVPVSGRSTINIEMQPDVQELSEVVVVGYGTVEKQDATGAVAVATEEEFNRGFQTSPEQLIQGRVSGVQITSTSGEPGGGSNIRIRGSSSIRAGNNPLIVLDGVPLDGRDVSPGSDVGAGRSGARNPLNFINPNDIESMSILKDASATAIYGSRGANGVIIITTKKGAKGKPQLEYNASVGFSWVPEDREYDLLSAGEFTESVDNPNLNYGSDVDAFEEITRTGIVQNHVLSYGGSTEYGQYRISMSYQDQEGVIENTGMEKVSTSINVGQNALNDRVKLQGTIIASYIEDEATAVSDNVGAEGDMLTSALRWNPTRPFRDSDGNFIQPSDNQRNPLAFLDYYSDYTETSRIFGNISATVNLIEGLDYKINFGLDRSEAERSVGVSRLLNANFVSGGIGNIENITSSSLLIENTLTYQKEISDNIQLNALAGYSYQEFTREGSNQRGTSFIIDDQNTYISNLNYASAFLPTNNSSFADPEDFLQSYFGRVNIDFFGKYLITGTVRTDGSSRFGENNEYGTFPSLAAKWRLVEEDFVPDLFSDLSLRVGWGITGNRELPPGRDKDQYKPLDDGSGVQLALVGNPDLSWEETTQWNVGLEFGFFDNRLTGSLDWYNKQTTDILFRLPVTQPGPDALYWRNYDNFEIINKGFDLGLDAVVVDNGDLTVNVGINASYFDNEIQDNGNQFPTGIITGEINGQGLSNQRSQLLYDGQDLYAFYLPIFNGFDENGASTYVDLNGDGENSASSIEVPGTGDRAFVGSPNPDYNLGIRASANYKNFDASVYFNGVFGHQVFDNTALALFNRAALMGGNNVDERVLETPQAQGDASTPSTRFLEDADFLRLSNLTIGYTLTPSELSWLSSLRIYLTGQNLLLFTGYDGFDPEVNTDKNIDGVPSFGIDYASYPRPRTITFGLSVVF